MVDQQEVAVVRWSGQHGLTELLTAYHLQTEAEKGRIANDVEDLPDRYREEVLDPQTAFLGDVVLLAQSGDSSVGCLVLADLSGGRSEIKRLWTDPSCRGQGIASKMVNSAVEACAEAGASTVRLSVWEWRQGAISLYQRLGFAITESWDEREQLVCMQRPV
ncbi:MAG TPA: GNAT family N-acetyltransferase [Kineosporiaceae bacterium]|nr:GNAT family N-acetyltransferase [Kineosporiaceae bacterium]